MVECLVFSCEYLFFSLICSVQICFTWLSVLCACVSMQWIPNHCTMGRFSWGMWPWVFPITTFCYCWYIFSLTAPGYPCECCDYLRVMYKTPQNMYFHSDFMFIHNLCSVKINKNTKTKQTNNKKPPTTKTPSRQR